MDSIKVYDVAIIGSGPAGMTAAIYAKRLALDVIIFEFNAPGGMVSNTEVVHNYPGFINISGVDLSMAMYQQMMSLNVIYKSEKIQGIAKEEDKLFRLTGKKQYLARSVIIASGTINKVIGLESEKKFFYRGISWCAVCDGPLYKGSDVAVVGGGNSAISSAITLSKFANKVYVIHRKNDFRAEASLIKALNGLDNIVFKTNKVVTEFLGEDILESIKIEDVRDKTSEVIRVSCVFENIGKLPNTKMLQGIVGLTEEGYIKVTSEMRTSVEGLFACGDVTEKSVRQIATATSDGAIAAISADKYLK